MSQVPANHPDHPDTATRNHSDIPMNTGCDATHGSAHGIAPGNPAYSRAVIAALCAGLATFNALYATQALLPTFSDVFHVSPTVAALSVSATTGALALMVLPASVMSERWGRRTILRASVLTATALSLALAAMPSMGAIIFLRGLQGIAIAGVPAVVMAYLSEEMHPRHLGKVMGYYVSGTTLGGLIGRLIPGLGLEFFTWRIATLLSALFALATAVLTAYLLPAQRQFSPKKLTLSHEARALATHWCNPTLRLLFILPFLLMGSFVSLYNYLGFRLADHFGLPLSLASLVFQLYLSGTWSSARAGLYMNRFGRARVLAGSTALAVIGLALLAFPLLWTTLIGALLFTASFFAAHACASSWVGQVAERDRAEASATYMLAYYLGSSLLGWISGYFFAAGWPQLVGWLCALVTCALFLATRLRQRTPTSA